MKSPSLAFVKEISKKKGFKFSTSYDAIFISTASLDFGLFFKDRNGSIFFDSADLYNSDILNLSFHVIGMNIPKSPIRRVTLGNLSPLFFITNAIPRREIALDEEAILQFLESIYKENLKNAEDIDWLFERATFREETIFNEKLTAQSSIYETIILMCIIQKKYNLGIEYCNKYLELMSFIPKGSHNMVTDCLNYIKSERTK